MTSSQDLPKWHPFNSGFTKCRISHGWKNLAVFNRGLEGANTSPKPSTRNNRITSKLGALFKSCHNNSSQMCLAQGQDSKCRAKRVYYMVEIWFGCGQINSQLQPQSRSLLNTNLFRNHKIKPCWLNAEADYMRAHKKISTAYFVFVSVFIYLQMQWKYECWLRKTIVRVTQKLWQIFNKSVSFHSNHLHKSGCDLLNNSEAETLL